MERRPLTGRHGKKFFSEEVLPSLSEKEKSRLHFLGRIPYEKYLALLPGFNGPCLFNLPIRAKLELARSDERQVRDSGWQYLPVK